MNEDLVYQPYLTDLLDAVSTLELPDEDLGAALTAQVNLMAGIPPDNWPDTYLD